MNGIFKKADFVLAAVLIMMCVASFLFVYGYGSSGSVAEVSVDGKIYGTYSLDKDAVIDIDTEFGHNQLTVKNGRIVMSEADCPDHYCLNQHSSTGGINESSQTIICLPNKLVVSIIADDSSADATAPDAVSGSPGTGGADDEQ